MAVFLPAEPFPSQTFGRTSCIQSIILGNFVGKFNVYALKKILPLGIGVLYR